MGCQADRYFPATENSSEKREGSAFFVSFLQAALFLVTISHPPYKTEAPFPQMAEETPNLRGPSWLLGPGNV